MAIFKLSKLPLGAIISENTYYIYIYYIYTYWFVTFSFKRNKSSGTQVLRVFKMACHDKMTVLPNNYKITFISVVHVKILSKSKKEMFIIPSLALDDLEISQNITMKTKYVKFRTL
jgi:hypothetical protein